MVGKVTATLDVVSQRIEAIERPQTEGSWVAAQWLELTPTGQVQLVPRDKSRPALREAEGEQKFKDRNKKGPPTKKKEDKGEPVD